MGVAAGAAEDADGLDWAVAEAIMANEERRDHECSILLRHQADNGG